MADFRTARGAYSTELNDPAVRDRLLAMTHAEVGGQGAQAQQAFLESIFNRASARGQTLGQTLSGSYFPDVTHSRAARGVNDTQRGQYAPLLDEVLGGSNVSNYATGNASGTVGFAGGPQTSAFNGERYGVEGPDRKWARSMGFADDTPMTQAMASEGQRNMNPIEAALAQARTKLQGMTAGATPQGEDPGILSSLAQQFAPAAAPYVPSADTFDKVALAGSMLRDNPGATAAGVAAYKAKNQDSDVQTIAHGDNLIQINRRTGKVLGMTALPRTRTEPKIINVPDGSGVPGATVPKVVNPDGSLSTPEGAPETANRLTPGEKKEDETFAKEHAPWVSGGAEATKTGIDKLRGIAKELRDSEKKSSIFATKGNGADTIGDVLGPTGAAANLVPDALNAFINPKAKELKNRAWDAFQMGARGVLGSAYTEKEGRAFFESNYDASLSPSTNATNLEKKATAMEKAATAKKEASEFYQKNNGSLRGFKYATPSFDTFNDDTTPSTAAPTSGGYKVIKVH